MYKYFMKVAWAPTEAESNSYKHKIGFSDAEACSSILWRWQSRTRPPKVNSGLHLLIKTL